jgi:DNA invertase Pin-like site-specific DNA recombinase
VLTVTRIDRLARSTFNLFAIVKHVLGGLADMERDLIRTRTSGAGQGAGRENGP